MQPRQSNPELIVIDLTNPSPEQQELLKIILLEQKCNDSTLFPIEKYTVAATRHNLLDADKQVQLSHGLLRLQSERKKDFYIFGHSRAAEILYTLPNNRAFSFLNINPISGKLSLSSVGYQFQAIQNAVLFSVIHYDFAKLTSEQSHFLNAVLTWLGNENANFFFRSGKQVFELHDKSLNRMSVVTFHLNDQLYKRMSGNFPSFARYEIVETMLVNEGRSTIALGKGTMVSGVNGLTFKPTKRVIKRIERDKYSQKSIYNECLYGRIAGAGTKLHNVFNGDNDYLILYTDFVEGSNLLEFKLKYFPVFTISMMLELFFKLASKVATLHSLGVVHGDLKLENIIRNDVTGDVSIIDFEFSRDRADNQIINSGTRGYAPYEIFQKLGVSHKSDAFTLAITMLLMLLPIHSVGELQNYLQLMDNTINTGARVDFLLGKNFWISQVGKEISRKHYRGFVSVLKLLLHPQPERRSYVIDVLARLEGLRVERELPVLDAASLKQLQKVRSIARCCYNKIDATTIKYFNLTDWEAALQKSVDIILSALNRINDNELEVRCFVNVLNIQLLAPLRTKELIKLRLTQLQLSFPEIKHKALQIFSASYLKGRFGWMTLDSIENLNQMVLRRSQKNTNLTLFSSRGSSQTDSHTDMADTISRILRHKS